MGSVWIISKHKKNFCILKCSPISPLIPPLNEHTHSTNTHTHTHTHTQKSGRKATKIPFLTEPQTSNIGRLILELIQVCQIKGHVKYTTMFLHFNAKKGKRLMHQIFNSLGRCSDEDFLRIFLYIFYIKDDFF